MRRVVRSHACTVRIQKTRNTRSRACLGGERVIRAVINNNAAAEEEPSLLAPRSPRMSRSMHHTDARTNLSSIEHRVATIAPHSFRSLRAMSEKRRLARSRENSTFHFSEKPASFPFLRRPSIDGRIRFRNGTCPFLFFHSAIRVSAKRAICLKHEHALRDSYLAYVYFALRVSSAYPPRILRVRARSREASERNDILPQTNIVATSYKVTLYYSYLARALFARIARRS